MNEELKTAIDRPYDPNWYEPIFRKNMKEMGYQYSNGKFRWPVYDWTNHSEKDFSHKGRGCCWLHQQERTNIRTFEDGTKDELKKVLK